MKVIIGFFLGLAAFVLAALITGSWWVALIFGFGIALLVWCGVIEITKE